MSRRLLILLAVLALAVGVLMPITAGASSPAKDDVGTQKSDDRSHPLGDAQRALRAEAAEAQIHDKIPGGGVYNTGRGEYVELVREGEDTILTILGDFNDWKHNETIVRPDRSVDNTTAFAKDFSKEHYEDILFSDAPGAVSMRNFYIELSANRYTVNGTVTDWQSTPEGAAYYDDDNNATSDGLPGVWHFVNDSSDAWYDDMLGTMTPDEINTYLAQFDVWDRYDYDGDGNFDEPDGYVDHFQSVHPGEGEEAGGGVLGGTAIWSHRWYVYFTGIGVDGPAGNLAGGVQIGDSDLWIGDYTVEPENGGVGVFSHEFAHDLGLPDLYDTGGGENATGFWTLMSSGSWLAQSRDDIGSTPGHMGAWEKFQLGWLNYDVAFAGQESSHDMGPAFTNTTRAQGLFVVLPDKVVTEQIADPYEGDFFYYSGAGDDLDNTMYNEYTLAAGSSLAAKANVQIEVDWDYAYLRVSADGGTTWDNVETNLSTNDNPNGQNFGHGITGTSAGWVDLTADLSAYEGDVMLGFRYWTDGAAVEPGFMVDNIEITGYALDGAEVDAGWTYDGFSVTTGEETGSYFNAYVAENRTYQGYDKSLEPGPYNFGFQDDPALGNWVEKFPYQNGLLISYWDESQPNNNTSQHPGSGLILPIDSHPDALIDGNGGVWRNRVQSYDATFGYEPTDSITLHSDSQPSTHPSLPPVTTFDDTNSYWDATNPGGSVIVPVTGTTISIVATSRNAKFMTVEVGLSE